MSTAAPIPWVQFDERVVGDGHPTFDDVDNRPLKFILAQSDFDDDSDDFPGFLVRYTGVVSPEGVLIANPGTAYIDTAASAFYIKMSGTGNTGWAAIGGNVSGNGSPEGVVTASIGHMYEQRDGTSTGYPIWIKRTGAGNTGWVNLLGVISGVGPNSMVAGDSAIAPADNGIAFGVSAVASGTAGIAIGTGVQATATDTVAIGDGTDATAAGAVAIGSQAATSASSIAIGQNALARGTGAIIIGLNAVHANGQASDVVIGNGASSVGGSGVTIGGSASNASGGSLNSVCIAGTIAAGAGGSFVVIGGTKGATGNSGGVMVGFNTTGTDRPTAVGYNAAATGIVSVAVGYATQATATAAVGIGWQANASASQAIAIGQNSVASAADCIAIGNGATSAGGASIAIAGNTGSSTSAIAILGTLTGTSTAAIAIGLSTSVTTGSTNAVCIGNGAVCTGTFTTAVGRGCQATVTTAVAVGSAVLAQASAATCIGSSSTIPSTGTNSVAIGTSHTLTGMGANVVVIGANCVSGTNGSNVIIGNGSSLNGSSGVAIAGTMTTGGSAAGVVIQGTVSGAGSGLSVAVGGIITVNTSATAIGMSAECDVASSVAIGASARVNTTAASGIAIGAGATIAAGHNQCVSIGTGTTWQAQMISFGTNVSLNPYTMFCIGNGSDTSASAASVLYRQTNKSGADAAGTNHTVQPGLATGNAACGEFRVQNGDATTSGSTLQTATVKFVVGRTVAVGTAVASNHAFQVTTTATASGALATTINAQATLTAAANNDVMAAIRAAPTFSVGAFTGTFGIGLDIGTVTGAGLNFAIRSAPNRAVFGQTTNNTQSSGGLTWNQGGDDDEILSFKSSDVAHGMTTQTETDTYGCFQKQTAADGGVRLAGWSEVTIAIAIRGAQTTEDTTRSTAGIGPVIIDGLTKSGTTVTTPAANTNILCVRSGVITRFILDSDGDSHQDVGTAWTNFDEHDDIKLLNKLAAHVTKESDPLRGGLLRWMSDSRVELENLKLATFNDDGHHFVNMSRLTMLHTGAIRQLGARFDRIEKALMDANLLPASV